MLALYIAKNMSDVLFDAGITLLWCSALYWPIGFGWHTFENFLGFYWPERGSIFGDFSAHANGERRGQDRIEGWRRKGPRWGESLGTLKSARVLGIRRRHAPRYCKKKRRRGILVKKDALGRCSR